MFFCTRSLGVKWTSKLVALGMLVMATQVMAAPPQFLYENNFAGKWGSSGSADGEFTLPAGVALDSQGNVYVVDTSNSRVQKFDAEGQFISKFGAFGAGDGQFFSPVGVAINNSNEIYVADASGNRVQHFDSDGMFIRAWGTGGSGDGQFQNPRNLTIAPGGRVYVADYGNDRIQVFEADGTFVRKFGTSGSNNGELSFPGGIAVDGSGNVFVVDAGNNRIQVFNASDTFVRTWGTVGSGDGQFDFPKDLALGADGLVYITDFNNDRVQAFTSEGTFVGKWGTAGNDDGQFEGPEGIAVTAAGRVYVSNADMGVGNRVQFFDPIWNVSMDEDGTPTAFSLTLQATDADMDTISWSISGQGINGTAGASGTGNSQMITYAPNPDFNGGDSFEVQIDDGNAGTATRTVTVTVAPINDAPVIDQGDGPLSVTMSEDGNPDPFVAPTLTAIDPENDTLTWSVTSAASNGTATVSGTGLMPTTFTYVPTMGFTGMDAFTVEVSDGTLSDTVVVNVTVVAAAVPPIIDQGEGPLAVTMDEEGVFTAPALSATDMDTAPAGLTWSVAVPATFGVAEVSGTGAAPATFTYAPAPDFAGSDSFTVQVSDGALSDTIVINVTVNNVNDAPVIDQGAGPLSVTMSEDSTPTDFVSPTISASDIDSGTLTWALASPASNGTATVSGTGASPTALDYTPSANFAGSDSFTVQVSDGALSDTIVVNVTVSAVNDGPTIDQGAGPLSVTMEEDGTFTAPAVSATDIDTDEASLVWSVVAPASNGTASASGNGAAPAALTYVPQTNFNGSDSFTVQVSDGTLTDTIVINVTITAVNDDPEISASGTSVTMDEDGGFPDFSILSITASDVEGPNGAFMWSVSTQGSKGTAAVAPAGASPFIFYFPRENENGADSFTLTVSDGDGGTAEITLSLTITPQPDTPVIDQGDSVMATYTNQGAASNFDSPTLTATDADGDELTWSLLTAPGNGTATVAGTGASPTTLEYASDTSFRGTDTFVVAVADGDMNTDTITISVEVTKENDAPIITEGDGPLVVTMAEDGTFTAPALSATDVDGDPLTWSVSVAAGSGTATASGTAASPTTLNYAPEANFNGTDRFTVEVADGLGGTDAIEIIVTVSAVNDPPVIAQGNDPLEITMDEDGVPIAFVAPELSATDIDSDVAALTWAIASMPSNGTATATGTGATPETLTYVPDDNFTGEDSFLVTVSDGTGGFSSLDAIEIQVTVNSQPDAPEIAQGDMVTVTMDEDGSPTAFMAPEVSVVDVDDTTFTWSVVTPAGNGVATVTGTGTSPTVNYAPTADYFGADTFTLRVTDSTDLVDEITVDVTINSVVDLPSIAQGDSVTVAMDEDGSPTAFTAPELEAVSVDVSVDEVVWSLATAPEEGTAVVSGTGAIPDTITYVPFLDYNGSDQFTVQIANEDGALDQIVVNVEIAPINDAPRFDTLVTQEPLGSWEVPVPDGAEALDRLVLALGPENNVYVADNTHIRIYSPEGEFLRDFAEVKAEIFAVDGAGSVYVAVQRNEDFLVKYAADGTLDTEWPANASGFRRSLDHQVTHISAAADGSIEYLSLTLAYDGGDLIPTLWHLNPAGRITRSQVNFGDLPQIGIFAPLDTMVVPENGRLVAARDREGSTYLWRQNQELIFLDSPFPRSKIFDELTIFSPQGLQQRSLRLPSISSADAIRRLAVRPDGQRIYTTEDARGEVDVRTTEGFYVGGIGDPDGEEGMFASVSGIVASSDGHVYVSDRVSGRISYFEEVPAERNVTVSMKEDGTFVFPYNAVDPEEDIVTWTILSEPETGTATGGLSLGYTPPADFNGEVRIEATVEDEEGATTDIIVNVVVEPVEDVPVITQGDADVLVTMTENGIPVAFSAPSLSATDGDGDELTWSVEPFVRYPFSFFSEDDVYYDGTVGTVAIGGTGPSPTSFTYAPRQDYVGTDSFTVVVSDSKGNQDRVVIRIIISSASADTSVSVLAELLDEDFENTDLNGDGVLSRDETIQRYPNITNDQFDEMDTNGDGLLSPEEIQAAEAPPTIVCNMQTEVKNYVKSIGGRIADVIVYYLDVLLFF